MQSAASRVFTLLHYSCFWLRFWYPRHWSCLLSLHRTWLWLQEPDLYWDGIFKPVWKWAECISVLGQFVEK